jgi:hypothetical protein
MSAVWLQLRAEWRTRWRVVLVLAALIALASTTRVLVTDGVGVATDPAIPIMSVLFTALAALLVANAVAFVPGRFDARTRPALILRAE